MSQTITPPAPGGGQARAVQPPPPGTTGRHGSGPPDDELGPVGRVVLAVQRGLEGTPGHLRIAAGVAIIAALVAGLGGGFALWERASALSEARESAANVVLLQGVRTNLGQADADAANAFLTFGLEPLAQQQDYAKALTAAATDLTAVARGANAADAAVLGTVNDQVTQYSGYVESARANNRLGVQVGASYLTVASNLMREKILVQLGDVAANEQKRTDAAYDRASRATAWLALAAVVGVGGLLGVQVWLAQRSRRILNLPALVATGLLVVALVGASALMAVAQNRANDVREGTYARTTALGEARVKAFDAKSHEALTLIERGSGTPADTEWTTSFNAATAALARAGNDSSLVQPLEAYRKAHAVIRKQDNAGDWDVAVKTAAASGDASANGTFGRFAGESRDALASSAKLTDDGLAEARSGLMPMAWLLVLVGLLAAGGAWWGISLRLDEYR